MDKISIILLITIFGLMWDPGNLFAQVEIDPVTGFPIEEQEETGPVIGSDTSTVKKTKYDFRKTFNEYYPHPKTALYLGLGFPGGGQLYNKDWWKVPFIWGAYGAVTYLIIDNGSQYRLLRDAVLIRLSGGEDMFINSIPSIQALRQRRDGARKALEQSYIALVFTHLLSSAESFVAAHLKGFNVSEDVSLQLSPAALQPSAIALRSSFKPLSHIGLGINATLTF